MPLVRRRRNARRRSGPDHGRSTAATPGRALARGRCRSHMGRQHDGLAVPGLLIAVAVAATGWRGRDDLRVVLLTGFGAGAVFIVGVLATGAG